MARERKAVTIVDEEIDVVTEQEAQSVQVIEEEAIYVDKDNQPFDRFYQRELADKCELYRWDINAVLAILEKPWLSYNSGEYSFVKR